VLRVTTGLFWLYFAQQKWHGVGWMRDLIVTSPRVNPIPGLREFLAAVVAPNWFPFALAQGAGETAVALLLLLGLATRWAALLGALLALNLSLTVSFLTGDVGLRWLYYLALAVNLQVLVAGGGRLAVDRLRPVPRWVRAGA
jgi:uncharacterized membrane protein YphA (DoxX/SURF4 family)